MLNEGIATFTANGTLAQKRRVKLSAGTVTVPPQVEYAGLGEQHIGITEYGGDVASGDPIAVRLRSYPGTHEMVAAKDIAIATTVYGAANGKVSDASSGSAIGITKETAGADGDIIEILPFNVMSTTAATVSILDAGSFTATATVEAALAELYQGQKSVQATLQPAFIRIDSSAAAIAAFANAGADGWTQMTDKEIALRWNNGGTPTDFAALFILPQDLDDTADMVVHYLGAIVKAGANEVDSPLITTEAYFSSAGAAPAAGADVGSDSTEFLTAGTDTYQEKIVTLAAADVPAAPGTLTLVFHPKDGQLGTDDFVMFPPWIEYKRKVMTS